MSSARPPHAETTPAGNPGAQRRRVVAAFDVDGTLTTRDTLLPFLVLAFGRARVATAFAACWRPGLRFLLQPSTINAFKVRVVTHLFAGEPAARLRRLGPQHARRVLQWLRPAALERLRWHQQRGHAVVLVSATLDLYLAHVAAALGVDHLLCTTLSSHGSGADEVFYGGLAGDDCSGAEKPRRLAQWLGGFASVELHAYGDGPGDRELLAVADHAHFRPFR